jgi:hypothetical protein
MDMLEASVGDNGTNLTFKLTLADLSATALADAATAGGTPTWLVTWFERKNGLGPATMTSDPKYSHWFVKCLDASAAAPQFVYGKVSSVDSAALGAPTPKALTYVPLGTATGTVVGNVITISVPLSSVGPLIAGDKIDHIIAYSLVEHASDPTLNDWAEQVKSFSYVIGTPAAAQHLADGYVEVSLNNFATSTRATLNNANNTWTASIPGTSGTVCARQVLAKDLYTPVWDDVQAGPVSCVSIGGPPVPTVVSRKTHGGAGTFDIPLPLAPNPIGIECRSGGPSNNHTVVMTFALPVTFSSATVCSGTGSVQSSSGSGTNTITANLTGVTNAQRINVCLLNATDGTNSGTVTVPMGVLLGDTTADGSVNSADISQTKSRSGQTVGSGNFRSDVTVDGSLNSADISLVKSKSGTALP